MPKMEDANCPKCDGKKKIVVKDGDKDLQINCPICRGHGKIKVPAKEAR